MPLYLNIGKRIKQTAISATGNLFLAGILQGNGILKSTTIIGVP